jgi:hypothetical protein
MSQKPPRPRRKPFSDQERQQMKDLLRFLGIVLLMVIAASLVMGFIVTNFL